jgi:hypothetical protein
MRFWNLLAGVAVAAAVLLTSAGADAQKRPPGWDKGNKPWKGTAAAPGNPPGFSRGLKVGWHGGSLPPGLAKKPASP